MKEQLQIIVKTHFGKHNPGDRIIVDSENGVALNHYWRKKITEARVNNCVSVKVRSAEKELTKVVRPAAAILPPKVDQQNTKPKRKLRNRSHEND